MVYKDPYKVLGSERGDSTESIKKRYLKLSRQHHPDLGGSHETYVEIQQAYQLITNDLYEPRVEVPVVYRIRHKTLFTYRMEGQ